MKNKLRNYLNEHFTDRVDASLDISLFEYGTIRNPDTNQTVYCVGMDGEYCVTWMDITVEDVVDALEEMPKGFFDYIDSTKEEEIKLAKEWPRNLANVIDNINSYNGWFRDVTYYPASNHFALRRLIKNER